MNYESVQTENVVGFVAPMNITFVQYSKKIHSLQKLENNSNYDENMIAYLRKKEIDGDKEINMLFSILSAMRGLF